MPDSALLPRSKPVEHIEHRNGYYGVGRCANQFVDRQQTYGRVAQQPPCDEIQQSTLQQAEAEVQRNAVHQVFDIYREPNACSDVADNPLRDAVHPKGMVRKAVLEEANQRSRYSSSDLAAPRDGEEDHRDQRQIEDREARKRLGQHHLQQDAYDRYQQRNRRMEAILIKFASGCVTVFGHSWGFES